MCRVKISRIVPTVLLVAMVFACQSVPLTKEYPALSWADQEPYRLDVSRIEVVSEYQPPMSEPNIDHLMPVPPVRAMEQWASERLMAVGTGGIAKVVIQDASAVDTPLETKDMFTEEQSNRFEMNLDIQIEIWNERGFRNGYVVANATRLRTIPEGSSLADREDVWQEMTRAAMADLDGELDRVIRKYLDAYLR